MGLSCSCPDYDDSDWYFYAPEDFSVLDAKRAVRCRSCEMLIKSGQECVKFERFRYAKDWVEENIYGDGNEIYMASWYYCAKCGEQFLNLSAYGYCVPIGENVFDLLNEHHEMHNVKVVRG